MSVEVFAAIVCVGFTLVVLAFATVCDHPNRERLPWGHAYSCFLQRRLVRKIRVLEVRAAAPAREVRIETTDSPYRGAVMRPVSTAVPIFASILDPFRRIEARRRLAFEQRLEEAANETTETSSKRER